MEQQIKDIIKLRDNAFKTNKIENARTAEKEVQNLLSQNGLTNNNLLKNNNSIEQKTILIYQTVINNDKATDKNVVEANRQILKNKIREQKQILKNKIINARKKAFITGKKQEVERVENEIHNLLAKHNLTEEDLIEDND